jgi:hypothetical protein
MTPIGSRLSISLDDEYLRMQNEWFFKWHFIGDVHRAVEIDSFRGKPICYGGIKFSGTAHQVYWDTIQYYLRKKIGSIFDNLEEELKRYPFETRANALNEVHPIVTQFAAKIQRAAIDKDRILRGNGIQFPQEHNFGHWQGCHVGDIAARIDELRRIYCEMRPAESLQPTKPHPRPEIVTLKPGFWGMNIDVKEAFRRLWRWWFATPKA